MRRTWGVYSEVLGFAAGGGTVKTGGFIKDERGLPRRYGTAETAEKAADKYRKANRGSPAVRITVREIPDYVQQYIAEQLAGG